MTASKVKIKKVCEYCGEKFYAQKVSTRYCSHQCNSRGYKANKRAERIKKTEGQVKRKLIDKSIEDVKDKLFLSVSETATLLGLSIPAIYQLVYRGKLKASKISSRLTLINREDIDALLTDNPYVKRSNTLKAPITELYTSEEVIQKYGIIKTSLFRIGKRENIPRVFNRGTTYWSQKHIDQYFSKQLPDSSIKEWYSVAEIIEKFGMTRSAIYSLAYDHNIPKKEVGTRSMYSKYHIDKAKGLIVEEEPQYYTIKEAMEKFNLTRDELYGYTKRNAIPKIKEGRIVKISKPELDKLFEPIKIEL